MPEWSIGAVSKTVVPSWDRGFESLSFRNLKRPKTVKNGQTADYQIVLRFFRVFSLRLRTESRPQKRPIQTVFWRMVKNLCLGVKIT